MIFVLRLGVGRPSSEPELTCDAVAGERLRPVDGVAGRRLHDLDDRQLELLREREVALVVRRARAMIAPVP